MDILMIYWNSVWAHGQPEPASFLSHHSSAEMRAFERRLHPTREEAETRTRLHLMGRRWTVDRTASGRVPN